MITERTLKTYRGKALFLQNIVLTSDDKDFNIDWLKNLVEQQARVIMRLTGELMDIHLMKSKHLL